MKTTESTKSNEDHLLPHSIRHLFFVRVLVFVSLVVTFDLWLVRHTGYGLGDPRVIGGIGGILFFAFSLFKGVVSTANEKRWKTTTRRIIAAVLDFRLLAGLCAIVVFAMLTISSVTIIPGADDLGRKAVLQSVDRVQDGIKMDLNSQAVRRWVWSSPFGRIYRILLDGYLPGSVEVYPLLGTTINPARDLRRSPTILIRPSIKALQSLKQCETVDNPPDAPVKRCGWFRLRGIDDFENCMEIERIEGHSSSFLIGWPQAMPPGILQNWKLELTILGTARVPGIEAETIMAWKEPTLLTPGCPPKVGAVLRAEVYTKSGEKEIVAGKTFKVTNTPFVDVLMETVTQTGETSNEN